MGWGSAEGRGALPGLPAPAVHEGCGWATPLPGAGAKRLAFFRQKGDGWAESGAEVCVTVESGY